MLQRAKHVQRTNCHKRRTDKVTSRGRFAIKSQVLAWMTDIYFIIYIFWEMPKKAALMLDNKGKKRGRCCPDASVAWRNTYIRI